MTALRDRCGECCGLQVRQGGRRVTVIWAQSTHSIVYRGHVGQVMPLQPSAAGKVFMAFDPEVLALVLDEGLTARTPRTVVDPAVLRGQLEEVREQGWAFSEEELEPGLNSLAVPVRSSDGRVIAAVSLGAPRTASPPPGPRTSRSRRSTARRPSPRGGCGGATTASARGPHPPRPGADPVALTMSHAGRTVETALRQWLPRCGKVRTVEP